jgi:ATP-binding cassette, subfamily B, bacterial MsbA
MIGIDDPSNYDARHAAKVRHTDAWPIYRRLLGYVFRYKTRLIVSMVLSVVVAGSFGAILVGATQGAQIVLDDRDNPARTQVFVDEFQENNPWVPAWIVDRYESVVRYMRDDAMRGMRVIAVFVLVIALVSGTARFFQEYLAASIATHVTIQLGREMYANIIHLPLRFFEQRNTGEIIARQTNDVFMAGRGLTNVFMKLFREPIKAAVFLGIAIWQDAVLTLIALVVLPPVAYVIVRIGQRVRKRMRRSLERIATLQGAVKESVDGIAIIKAYGLEDRQTERVDHEYRGLGKQLLRMVRADAAIGPITEFILVCGFVMFILLSAQRAIREGTEWADLVVLYGALGMMFDPIRKLSSVNNAIQTSVASSQRAFEFIDMQSNQLVAADAIALPRLQKSIRFEHVEFAYERDKPVLVDVDFQIRKGEMVAVVGHSGEGKTTLAKLVPRLYDVGGGAITIDGTDIRQATFASLRDQIGIVTQDTILFDDTVASNIAAGAPGATDAEIKAAAEAANAAKFIEALPQGYDTRIGEGGNRLSGGQRQRLAIARALIKDPAILILDEATSSLDSESEHAIQKAIESSVVGRTTLVIAHRLSTIRQADRIVVLDAGRVVEHGSHDELIARPDSIYGRLYRVQFGVAAN